jgi:hypothetical protein
MFFFKYKWFIIIVSYFLSGHSTHNIIFLDDCVLIVFSFYDKAWHNSTFKTNQRQVERVYNYMALFQSCLPFVSCLCDVRVSVFQIVKLT